MHNKEKLGASKKYFVPATIVKLGTSSPWSYLSCARCGSVRLDDTNYFCSKGHTMTENPINRYSINVDILDSTMSTTITAFDKEAEGLIGQGVDAMLSIDKLDNGFEKIENIFQKLAGTDALFEIRPSNYEMNNTDTFLTARRVIKTVASSEATTIPCPIFIDVDQRIFNLIISFSGCNIQSNEELIIHIFSWLSLGGIYAGSKRRSYMGFAGT